MRLVIKPNKHALTKGKITGQSHGGERPGARSQYLGVLAHRRVLAQARGDAHVVETEEAAARKRVRDLLAAVLKFGHFVFSGVVGDGDGSNQEYDEEVINHSGRCGEKRTRNKSLAMLLLLLLRLN